MRVVLSGCLLLSVVLYACDWAVIWSPLSSHFLEAWALIFECFLKKEILCFFVSIVFLVVISSRLGFGVSIGRSPFTFPCLLVELIEDFIETDEGEICFLCQTKKTLILPSTLRGWKFHLLRRRPEGSSAAKREHLAGAQGGDQVWDEDCLGCLIRWKISILINLSLLCWDGNQPASSLIFLNLLKSCLLPPI